MIEAWLLCRRHHADLSGEGARIAGGRWNRRGRSVVYLAEHPALTLLEVRVHLDLLPDDYVLACVHLPGEPPGVPADKSDLTEASDMWLRDDETAVLRVPSALVPFAASISACSPVPRCELP